MEFCANSAPIEGLNVIDVAHNIGATANAVVKALTILRDNMDSNLTELFTKPQNTPTPMVRTCTNWQRMSSCWRHTTQCSHHSNKS